MGQEGHAEAWFCNEACQAKHGTAWVRCIEAAYRADVEAEATEYYEKTGRIRSDRWIEQQTKQRSSDHFYFYRPDLRKWWAAVPSNP